MNAIKDAVNDVEKAVNGVTALGTIIMHIVLTVVVVVVTFTGVKNN